MDINQVLLVLCLIACAKACGLGRTITNITINKNGEIKVQCSVRAYPNCPKVCAWTNQTCEEAAKLYKWKREELIMTNLTNSSQLRVDRTQKVSRGETSANEIQRRCCVAGRMSTTPCRNVNWKPNGSKSQDTFDVIQYAAQTMKCPSKNAYVKDVRRIDSHFVLEICCMNYTSDFKGRVVCLGPRKPGDLVKEATAISLGVALGIGIPLQFLQPRKCNNLVTLTDTDTREPGDSIFPSTPDECRAACYQEPHPLVCNYDPDTLKCHIYWTFTPTNFQNTGGYVFFWTTVC